MTNLPDRSGPSVTPEMRAGDADRERVAQVLRDAAGDGRLTLEELDERLTAVYAAKTYADLEPSPATFPSPARRRPRPRRPGRRTGGRWRARRPGGPASGS